MNYNYTWKSLIYLNEFIRIKFTLANLSNYIVYHFVEYLS